MEILDFIIPFISAIAGSLGVFLTSKSVKRKANLEADKAEFDLKKEVEDHYASRLSSAYDEISKLEKIIEGLRLSQRDLLLRFHNITNRVDVLIQSVSTASSCDHNTKDSPCPIITACTRLKIPLTSNNNDQP